MKNRIADRVIRMSYIMIEHQLTLGAVAKWFNVSRTTAWRDMNKRLPLICREQYEKVRTIINRNSHKGSVLGGKMSRKNRSKTAKN